MLEMALAHTNLSPSCDAVYRQNQKIHFVLRSCELQLMNLFDLLHTGELQLSMLLLDSFTVLPGLFSQSIH